MSRDQIRSLRRSLDAVCAEADLAYSAILGEDGVVVVDSGQESYRDSGEIGALAVGAFASVREVARRCGEEQFRGLYQEGVTTHLFLSPLGERFLLLSVFGNSTRIAIVRAQATEVSPELCSKLYYTRSAELNLEVEAEVESEPAPDRSATPVSGGPDSDESEESEWLGA